MNPVRNLLSYLFLRSILNYLLNYAQVLEVFPYLQVSQLKPARIYLLPARKLTHTYGLQNITERVKTLEYKNKVRRVSFLANFHKNEIYIHILKVSVLVLAWVIE